VDDRLPVDKHSNLLCSHTTGTRNQLELWVTIIEKAYMKLCGGYDFPGSNSGVDLFSLTGWIPERIFFAKNPSKVRDFETEPERAWERLYSANSFGDCLITVSTTRDLTEDQAETLGLVTGHAYAVLNVLQTKNGARLLQMKNPWAAKVWAIPVSIISSVDTTGSFAHLLFVLIASDRDGKASFQVMTVSAGEIPRSEPKLDIIQIIMPLKRTTVFF
jgi:calpain-7